MKLPRQMDRAIHEAFLIALINTQLTLTRIERDLQVFDSELVPDLHELNAQLDKFRERVEQKALNYDHQDDKDGGQEPPSTPSQ